MFNFSVVFKTSTRLVNHSKKIIAIKSFKRLLRIIRNLQNTGSIFRLQPCIENQCPSFPVTYTISSYQIDDHLSISTYLNNLITQSALTIQTIDYQLPRL